MAAISAAARLAANLARLPAAAQPTKFMDVWRKPALSLRKVNVMRKQFVEAGRPLGEFPLQPKETKTMKSLMQKRKGHKPERLHEERQAKIKGNMERMPKIIEEWKKEKREAKLKDKPELPF